MVITSIPVGVYAGQIGGINTGSSTVFSNPSSNPEAKFGGFSVEGVRCYIYDKSSDNILKSEVFEGKKAIDFLGYRYSGDTTVYDFTVSHVDGADINTTTAFGNIESTDEIELSMDYPFEFDGTSIIMHITFMMKVIIKLYREQKIPMKNSKKTMERNYPI